MHRFINIEICLPLVQIVLVFMNSVTSSNTREGLSHPATDFKYHSIVEPVLYHKKLQEIINTTKESNGFHVEHLFVSLVVDNETFQLDLILNKQLLADGFFHRYQENGMYKIYTHNNKDIELCEYHGKIRGKSNSWVAISTCEGVEGVIFDGKELHYISRHMISSDSAAKGSIMKHFFYSHSNLASHNKSCGETNPHDHILRYKRNLATSSKIHGPYNANKSSKYVELVLVIDNGEYESFRRNMHRVLQHGKNIINMVNGFYTPLNIFVVLTGIVIWSEKDEIVFTDGDITLSNFASYRKKKLLKDHPNDNAQLLGKFKLVNGNVIGNSDVIGKAFTGAICSFEHSVGINVDHSDVVGVVAGTIAHELGHNFGMHHDDTDCKCPGEHCLMSPVTSYKTTSDWSSCSLIYLLLSFTHGLDYCLRNQPRNLLYSPVCGNGFVERGEECDCGLSEYCNNNCCNATSCMLNSDASCASGDCCDLSVCKLKKTGALCRSADFECDLPEYCTGQTEFCPLDTYKMNTEPCSNGQAYCYQGYCKTRTDQCKLLWGFSGRSCDEERYNKNIDGSTYGNCGYNKYRRSFKKCQHKDNLCGLLHCRGFTEDPEFGLSYIWYTNLLTLNGTGIPCRTIWSDFGEDVVDPAMVPNGAPCGNGKMCVDQKCKSLESLRIQGRHCPNCINGWCNNLGHCHCKDGFAPPTCESTGPGGSEDSGPATFINGYHLCSSNLSIASQYLNSCFAWARNYTGRHQQDILGRISTLAEMQLLNSYIPAPLEEHQLYHLVLYIIFLGIVPIIAICAFVIYWLRRKGVHGNLTAKCPSAFFRCIDNVLSMSTCNCCGWLIKSNTGTNKINDLMEDGHREHQNKPEIVIESIVSFSTTNAKGVMNSIYVSEARENVKTVTSNRQDVTRIATISYPQSEKKTGNVNSLAKRFENLTFNVP